MQALENLRARIPEFAKDIRLNLQSVLQSGPLTEAQRYGTALAVATMSGQRELSDGLADAAREASVAPETLEDARAAAAIMAMNNVYYRFRHQIGKPSYAQLQPRLRMNRMGQPASSKLDFELFALAVSAVNGCETCVQAHERVVLAAGLTEEHVHDAVRIAAVVNAASVALSCATPPVAA